ncbi:zinc-dependent alcohol dehydrogenase [Ruicaihuangia caeni]|uniref:zinc-dependent alcohol dehydrogenase n=1 Tax=Ruicaihuangia caeni TaxID=3042517 RepID=UPI003390542C
MFAITKTDPSPGVSTGDVPKPTAGPGEVVIKVAASSICGTDLGLAFDWPRHSATWGSPLPMVLGHECSGFVVDAADDVDIPEGQLVVVETHIFCGECVACRNDAAHNCLNMQIPGVSRDGIWAEYAVIPERALYRVAPGVSPEHAALYEAAGVAMHATQRAGDVAGKVVAVSGAGPVGLFLIAMLKAQGAGDVLVLEPGESRRTMAEQLGATAFDLGEKDDFIALARERGVIAGADLAFEVSGAPSAYETLFDTLGKESTLVSIGHTSQPIPVNISRDVNLRVINWKGTFGRHIWSSWDRVDELVRSGKLDLQQFVGLEARLDEIPTILGDASSVPGKVVVQHAA